MGHIRILYFILIASIIGCKEPIVEQGINGYTDHISYYPGDTCKIYLNALTSQANAKLSIVNFDGEAVDHLYASIHPQDTNKVKPWENGFGYKLTAQYVIPKLPSGFYFIDNKIPIVIKSRVSKPITLVYPSNTLNAYNRAGGQSLYTWDDVENQETNIVSFMRPMPFSNHYGSLEFYEWVYDNYGTEINYICDQDLDNFDAFSGSKILLMPGHNEYWTRKARNNFDKYIDEGGHSIILSGNVMWWQIRYDSIDNKIICYKSFEEDPISDTLFKTINWSDVELNYPIIESIGANFINGGYGNQQDDGFDGYKIVSPNSPLLENTDLEFGDIIDMPTAEFDGAPLLGFTSDSIPIIDNSKLNFHKIDIIGYDLGFRVTQTVGTFIVFQKKEDSGIIINTGSTDWCRRLNFSRGERFDLMRRWPFIRFIPDESEVPIITTTNMIEKLLNDDHVFNEEV